MREESQLAVAWDQTGQRSWVAKKMVVCADASALNRTSSAMRKTLSPVRTAGRARSTSPAPNSSPGGPPLLHPGRSLSPVRTDKRERSRSPAPDSSPGPLLCAELNMSHARGSRTPPVGTTSSSNEAENWMDKVMGMLHEVTGHGTNSGIVGPASLALPSLTPEGKFQTTSPKQAQTLDCGYIQPRPLTPCRPSSAQTQEVLPNVHRGKEGRLYPTLPTFTASTRQNEPPKDSKSPMKVVFDDRTCRAGCGPARDLVNTSDVPPEAKNRDFNLDPCLIPEVGDWRGPLGARRGSPVYKLASSVVAAAYKMAIRESAQTKNILDR